MIELKIFALSLFIVVLASRPEIALKANFRSAAQLAFVMSSITLLGGSREPIMRTAMELKGCCNTYHASSILDIRIADSWVTDVVEGYISIDMNVFCKDFDAWSDKRLEANNPLVLIVPGGAIGSGFKSAEFKGKVDFFPIPSQLDI